MKIKYIKWGLAYKRGNEIHLNETLKEKEFSRLRKKIIEHELKHNNNLKNNIIQDYNNIDINDIIDFCLIATHNPRVLTQFIPVSVYEKRIYYNKTLLLTYIAVILGVIIGFYIVNHTI